MNIQVLTDPFGRLLWVSPALPGATHDLTAARSHGIVDALAAAGLKCWADKGVPRHWPAHPSPLPGPPTQPLEAAAQQPSRQDPLRRRAGHCRAEGLTTLAEAPLQHQPDHRHREGSRPPPIFNVSLEKAPYAFLRDVVSHQQPLSPGRHPRPHRSNCRELTAHPDPARCRVGSCPAATGEGGQPPGSGRFLA